MRSGYWRMKRRGVNRSRSRRCIRAIALRHHRLRFRFMLRFMLLRLSWGSLCLQLLIFVACKHSACVLSAPERECTMGWRRKQATGKSFSDTRVSYRRCRPFSGLALCPLEGAQSGRGCREERAPAQNPLPSWLLWLARGSSRLHSCPPATATAFHIPPRDRTSPACSLRSRPMSTAADSRRRKYASTSQAQTQLVRVCSMTATPRDGRAGGQE